MMKYKIVYSTGTGNMQEAVNELLEKGWQLRGDLIAHASKNEGWFVQVLVKEEEKEPEITPEQIQLWNRQNFIREEK